MKKGPSAPTPQRLGAGPCRGAEGQTAEVTSRAESLLAGPRGRRLCLSLVQDLTGWSGWPALTWSDGPHGRQIGRLDPVRAHESLAADVATTDLACVGAPERLLDALMASVDQARYWQPPDEVDQVLADDDVAALLTPVAAAVVRAPASQWWATPVDLADQHAVVWPAGEPPEHPAPRTSGTRDALDSWRANTLADEERAAWERPGDPAAPYSGSWWSVPAFTGGAVTSRALPGVVEAAGGVARSAPVGLVLVEDEMGWETARTWPVRPPAAVRVHEVTGPPAWAALVERYPLEVTAARRHDWYRTTGWEGRWAIPDWAAAAGDFDAVHLTVDGYLSTAGRAVPVPGSDARTVLAGAAPDATWWLADVPLGEPTDWRRAQGDLPRWAPA